MSGAPPKMSAQDFTTLLKRRVVSKSVDTSPQPAHRRYNYIPTMVRANRADQVVKFISDPTKSCSGGWTDTSRCCYNPPNLYADVVVNSQGAPCECSEIEIGEGCPGVGPLLPPFDSPKQFITIRFEPTSFVGTATGALIVVNPYINLTGTTVTIDGTPATITPSSPFGGLALEGNYTTSSVIVLNLPSPVNGLGAFCVNWVFGG